MPITVTTSRRLVLGDQLTDTVIFQTWVNILQQCHPGQYFCNYTGYDHHSFTCGPLFIISLLRCVTDTFSLLLVRVLLLLQCCVPVPGSAHLICSVADLDPFVCFSFVAGPDPVSKFVFFLILIRFFVFQYYIRIWSVSFRLLHP